MSSPEVETRKLQWSRRTKALLSVLLCSGAVFYSESGLIQAVGALGFTISSLVMLMPMGSEGASIPYSRRQVRT